jgi:hypothetical protein
MGCGQRQDTGGCLKEEKKNARQAALREYKPYLDGTDQRRMKGSYLVCEENGKTRKWVKVRSGGTKSGAAERISCDERWCYSGRTGGDRRMYAVRKRKSAKTRERRATGTCAQR